MVNSFYARKFQITMQGLGIKQYVNSPTRVTRDSQTLIDLIFANSKIKVQRSDQPKITDHSLQVEFNMIRSHQSQDKYRFSDKDYNKIEIQMNSLDSLDEFLRFLRLLE